MRDFEFTFYTRTAQGQEFKVGRKVITAKNYDEAHSQLRKMDLPFHHFGLVKSEKTKK